MWLSRADVESASLVLEINTCGAHRTPCPAVEMDKLSLNWMATLTFDFLCNKNMMVYITFWYPILSILNIAREHKYCTAILTYKLLPGTITLLCIKFMIFLVTPCCHTCSLTQRKFYIPSIRTHHKLFSLSYHSSTIWNTIDPSITKSPSLAVSCYRYHLIYIFN